MAETTRLVARVASGVGWAAVVVASLWAPAQPEFLADGAACEVAPCGTLEDPGRWHAAAVLWCVGASVALVAGVVLARPRPRPRPGPVVLGVVLAPLVLAGLVLAAAVVSWSTSALGAWTVLLLGAVVAASSVTGVVRGRRSATRDPDRSRPAESRNVLG